MPSLGSLQVTSNQVQAILSLVLLLGANFSINGCINSNLGFYNNYSEVAKGGFCLPCALFANEHQGVDLGTLVSRPLINLSKALEILCKHKEKKYHLTAITKCDDFLSVMQGQQPSISQHLNKSVADTVATNRQN